MIRFAPHAPRIAACAILAFLGATPALAVPTARACKLDLRLSVPDPAENLEGQPRAIQVLIMATQLPPTLTRCSLNDPITGAHYAFDWDPLDTLQLGRSVVLAPGTWWWACWAEPTAAVNGLGDIVIAPWAVDPDACGDVNAVGMTGGALRVEVQPAEFFVDETKKDSVGKQRSAQETAFDHLGAGFTFTMRPQLPTMEKAAESLSTIGGNGAVDLSSDPGLRAFGALPATAAVDQLLRLSAEVVLEEVKSQGFETVRLRLLSELCPEKEGPLGPGGRFRLSATCRSLQTMALEELLANGDVIVRAIQIDLATVAVRQMGRDDPAGPIAAVVPIVAALLTATIGHDAQDPELVRRVVIGMAAALQEEATTGAMAFRGWEGLAKQGDVDLAALSKALPPSVQAAMVRTLFAAMADAQKAEILARVQVEEKLTTRPTSEAAIDTLAAPTLTAWHVLSQPTGAAYWPLLRSSIDALNSSGPVTHALASEWRPYIGNGLVLPVGAPLSGVLDATSTDVFVEPEGGAGGWSVTEPTVSADAMKDLLGALDTRSRRTLAWKLRRREFAVVATAGGEYEGPDPALEPTSEALFKGMEARKLSPWVLLRDADSVRPLRFARPWVAYGRDAGPPVTWSVMGPGSVRELLAWVDFAGDSPTLRTPTLSESEGAQRRTAPLLGDCTFDELALRILAVAAQCLAQEGCDERSVVEKLREPASSFTMGAQICRLEPEALGRAQRLVEEATDILRPSASDPFEERAARATRFVFDLAIWDACTRAGVQRDPTADHTHHALVEEVCALHAGTSVAFEAETYVAKVNVPWGARRADAHRTASRLEQRTERVLQATPQMSPALRGYFSALEASYDAKDPSRPAVSDTEKDLSKATRALAMAGYPIPSAFDAEARPWTVEERRILGLEFARRMSIGVLNGDLALASQSFLSLLALEVDDAGASEFASVALSVATLALEWGQIMQLDEADREARREAYKDKVLTFVRQQRSRDAMRGEITLSLGGALTFEPRLTYGGEWSYDDPVVSRDFVGMPLGVGLDFVSSRRKAWKWDWHVFFSPLDVSEYISSSLKPVEVLDEDQKAIEARIFRAQQLRLGLDLAFGPGRVPAVVGLFASYEPTEDGLERQPTVSVGLSAGFYVPFVNLRLGNHGW